MSFALNSRLNIAMKNKLSSLDLNLSSYGEHRVEQIVRRGVERMAINKATERLDLVNLAERNLVLLMECLCDLAKENKTYPTLDDEVFDTALLESYPLWPYC